MIELGGLLAQGRSSVYVRDPSASSEDPRLVGGPREVSDVGRAEFSLWLGATPEQVWQIWADPSRIPEWQTGKPVIDDVRGAPGEVGSSYVVRRGKLAARTTVMSADPPRQLTTSTEAYLGMQMRVTSQLVESAGGTDLRFQVTTQWPPGRRLLGRLIELAVLNGREQRKELGFLQDLVEREADS